MNFKRFRALVLVAAIASLGRFAMADKIELPARAVAEDTQIVIRVDATAITADTLDKSKAIVLAMLGDAGQKAAPSAEEWQQTQEVRKVLTDAGVQQVVVTVGSFSGDTKPAVLFKLKAGTKPADLDKAIKELDAKNAQLPGNSLAFDKCTVKTLDGDWTYLEGPNSATPAEKGDDKALASFADSLGKQEGAPVRVALQLSSATKANLATTAANPDLPAFIKSLMEGLQGLEVANAGLTTGEVLKVKINADFPTPEAAKAFKKSLDTVLVLAPAMVPPEQLTTITVMAKLLTMTADGKSLSSVTDSNEMKDVLKEAAKDAAKPAGQ